MDHHNGLWANIHNYFTSTFRRLFPQLFASVGVNVCAGMFLQNEHVFVFVRVKGEMCEWQLLTYTYVCVSDYCYVHATCICVFGVCVWDWGVAGV